MAHLVLQMRTEALEKKLQAKADGGDSSTAPHYVTPTPTPAPRGRGRPPKAKNIAAASAVATAAAVDADPPVPK